MRRTSLGRAARRQPCRRLYALATVALVLPALVVQRASADPSGDSSYSPRLLGGEVGVWQFDGRDVNAPSSGQTRDASGAGNHLAMVNGPSFPAGRFGSAFSATGSQYLQRGDTASLDLTSSLTFTAWVKFNSFGDTATIMVKGRANGSQGTGHWNYDMDYDVNADTFRFLGNDSFDVRIGRAAAGVGIGEWHHFAGVVDGAAAQARFYVDGTLRGTTATVGSPQGNAWELTLGAAPFNDAPPTYLRQLNGLMDDARLYNRALSASEIASIKDFPYDTGASCEVPGPDAAGKTCSIIPYSWVDTSGGTTLTLGDDSQEGNVPLPFTYPWYGGAATWVSIGSNGQVCLSSLQCTNYIAHPIPDPASPNGQIACFWEDLNPGWGGFIRYKTLGSVPNRTFVVEYNGVPFRNLSGNFIPNTFQIHLVEGGEARCMLQSVQDDGGDGMWTSVGVEDWSGSTGVRYKFGAVGATNLGIRFSPDAASSGGTVNQNFDAVQGLPTGWTATGFWHVSTRRPYSTPNSLWYGQEATNNFDNGATNSGAATSPVFAVPASNPTLTFRGWYDTETGISYDRKFVEITTNGGASWSQLAQMNDSALSWNAESYNLTAYAGQQAQIRFRFDSVDAYANTGQGWFLDDVQVATGSPATVPGAPSNTSANASAAGEITLTWSPPASNGGASITGYKIYAGSSPTALQLLDQVGGNTNSFVQMDDPYDYTDDPLVGPRYYKISAVNSIGEGVQSTAATATGYAEYKVELRAWIPGSKIIDPVPEFVDHDYKWVVAADSEAADWTAGERGACHPDLRYWTTAWGWYEGDDHELYDGSFRVRSLIGFRWDGQSISAVYDPGGARFGETVQHRGYRDVLGYENSDCVLARETVDTFWDRTWNTVSFGLHYSSPNPVAQDYVDMPPPYDGICCKGLVPTIDGELNGTFLGNGDLQLQYTTDRFPSQGWRITRNGIPQYTVTTGDAECVNHFSVFAVNNALRTYDQTGVRVVQQGDVPEVAPTTPSKAC